MNLNPKRCLRDFASAKHAKSEFHKNRQQWNCRLFNPMCLNYNFLAACNTAYRLVLAGCVSAGGFSADTIFACQSQGHGSRGKQIAEWAGPAEAPHSSITVYTSSPLLGSNPRPYAYGAHALPTELRRRLMHQGLQHVILSLKF